MKSNYAKRLTEQQKKIIEDGREIARLNKIRERADVISETLFFCLAAHMEKDKWGQTRLVRFVGDVADIMDELSENHEKRKETEKKLMEKLGKGIDTAMKERKK